MANKKIKDLETRAIFAIKFLDPTLLEGKNGVNAVRFTLALTHEDHGVLFATPGFRVMGGEVKPPARKAGKFKWWPMVEIVNKDICARLFTLLDEWKVEFPSVQFPADEDVDFSKGEEEADEDEG